LSFTSAIVAAKKVGVVSKEKANKSFGAAAAGKRMFTKGRKKKRRI
jgi:hypothetical protein